MNRLDLTKMVNKNIRNQEKTNHFNATQINSEDFYDYKRYEAKLKEDHINIAGQINNIVAHVHTQLKNRKPSPPKPSIKFDLSNTKSFKKNPQKKEKVGEKKDNTAQAKLTSMIVENHKQDQKTITVLESTGRGKISIPRMKALCNRKEQKHIHQTMSVPSDHNNLENHKRIQEVIQQKVLLEKMLKDHKQLQHDRQTISREIFLMHSYLDNLRGRLNCSLKKLNNKKTYCECHGQTS